MELVALLLRAETTVFNINLTDLNYDGHPIGSYEISIRRTDSDNPAFTMQPNPKG